MKRKIYRIVWNDPPAPRRTAPDFRADKESYAPAAETRTTGAARPEASAPGRTVPPDTAPPASAQAPPEPGAAERSANDSSPRRPRAGKIRTDPPFYSLAPHPAAPAAPSASAFSPALYRPAVPFSRTETWNEAQNEAWGDIQARSESDARSASAAQAVPESEPIGKLIDNRLAALRVYVLESDITDAQQAVRSVVRQASF